MEELISFETAKLAKEKKFDWNVTNFFSHKGISGVCSLNSGIYENECRRPTQSLLQKWLREKHNIFVNPFANFPIGYDTPSYYDVEYRGFSLMQKFKSWEEAFEYALVYGLNKIQHG